jgi:hypothetical protein
MKSIINKTLLGDADLEILKALIDKCVTSFDINKSQYVSFDPIYQTFEAVWPGTITLITHSQHNLKFNIEFGSQNTLGSIENEVINLRLKLSSVDYSTPLLAQVFKLVSFCLRSLRLVLYSFYTWTKFLEFIQNSLCWRKFSNLCHGNQKLEYVHNNPVKTGVILEQEHYLYSSARDYAGQKGLIDIEILEVPASKVGYVHLG